MKLEFHTCRGLATQDGGRLDELEHTDLKYVAWDSNDCGSDEAREYTGRTPGEIATQHAEWMHRQGDPQKEYAVRVRATKGSIVREWEVCVHAEIEVSFHAVLMKTTADAGDQV